MKCLTWAFFFIFIFGVLCLWYASAQAPIHPQIVFVSERDGNSDIYVMDTDGTNVRNLTHHSAVDTTPCWSPDGQQIAFTSDRDNHSPIPWIINYELYIMDADGTHVRRLTDHPAVDAGPCWSPDGKQIAFGSDRDGNAEIYVMNADGTNPRNLTQHPSRDTGPQWSPDGTQIVFWSNRDGGRPEIYVMDADGKNPNRLTHNSDHDVDPCWSPDGKQIVFTSTRRRDPVRDLVNAEIYVMDRDGGNVRRLTDHPAANEFPRWFDPAFTRPVEKRGKMPSLWGRWKAKP